MDLNRKNINNSSSDVLIQLIKNIETPLASIIEANKKFSKLNTIKESNSKSNEVILSSSKEIADLIEEIVKLASGDKVIERVPLIYKIYHSNERVKSMCKNEINPQKISKQDTSWLLNLEDEVYKNIKHKDLNLYDLSYKLAVSERQLHRKIKNLVHLTPNKYIRVLRLHKAKQYIDDYLYDTISQISYEVGYYDTHYFSKLFKEQYNMYPKELLNTKRF
ncbi:helix-turn-helix transcriptional regulator [uncultured Kordia sp.]|uniref:helix-turn-helix domain-containing protein n=1 Tax=uncultured Kordia sp. TaxID=507699 RepID=UPI002611533B|nr:helix-turn-helix transcriptional regulator [uncultured Kordia sp.]